MKEFKFLKSKPKLRVTPGYLKFRDIHNREKYMFFTWSQFPTDGCDDNILTFRGNILGFRDLIRNILPGNIPTVYEIYKQYRGDQTCIVYGNHFNHDKFMARKYMLTIHYSI